MTDIILPRRKFLVGAASLLMLASCDNFADNSKVDEAGEALGYACGYVAGENAILSKFVSDVPPMKDNGCDGVRASAAKHGFTQ